MRLPKQKKISRISEIGETRKKQMGITEYKQKEWGIKVRVSR